MYAGRNSSGGVDADVAENSLAICADAVSLATVLEFYYYNNISLSTGAGIFPRSIE